MSPLPDISSGCPIGFTLSMYSPESSMFSKPVLPTYPHLHSPNPGETSLLLPDIVHTDSLPVPHPQLPDPLSTLLPPALRPRRVTYMHQLLTSGFRLNSANGRHQQEPGGWEESQVGVFTVQPPSLFSVGRRCPYSWPSLYLQLQVSTASGNCQLTPSGRGW